MKDPRRDEERRLEAADSQAATTPLAQHDDELSPTKAVRETAAGGQRVGDSGPIANPITVFPDAREDEDV